MQFLIDASGDARLINYLKAQEHQASFIPHSHRPGMADTDVLVLALAHQENCVLITDDRDFGELIFRYAQPHAGGIFFRLRDATLSTRLRRLDYVLEHYAGRLQGFLTVTEDQVRVRSI